jgi:hypothetical protein
MLIDLRPAARLRGTDPLDVPEALSPVLTALAECSEDLSRTRVTCDWVQYKNSFREPVDVRWIVPPERTPVARTAAQIELALDLRSSRGVDLMAATRAMLARPRGADSPDRVYLEGWTAGSGSVIWQFNAVYWRALSSWEAVSGRAYEQALPGGESDATNVTGVRDLIRQLVATWDSLAARNALPETLYVVELGVGNGSQARVWLDQFCQIEAETGSDYYRRLHYLMADYSPHVLELARAAVLPHAEHTSSVVLDATHPTTALGFLRYNAFLVYVSNVYDNLPTDEVASIGGRTYLVDVRAYLPADLATKIAEQFSLPAAKVPETIAKLLRLGPDLLADATPDAFPDVRTAVEFWRACWAAVRLEERYTGIEGLDTYQIAPGVSGEALRPLLEVGGDIRMQASNAAAASFIDTLTLLHPYGHLHCHDIFVTDLARYRQAFSGPGKYDGSVVNWVNGVLLSHLGRRRGYEVAYQPFAHRTGSNISTLTARIRD